MATSKNNLIPLVLAVFLAVGAVYLVQRQMNQKEKNLTEEKVGVVYTTRDLKAGVAITRDACDIRQMPRSAVPPRAILQQQLDMILNQTLVRPLPGGSYIQLGDVNVEGGLSELVDKDNWAVSISLNGGAISKRLRPNDRIAIIGTFDIDVPIPELKDVAKEVKGTPNNLPGNLPGKLPTSRKRKVTTVILPDVKILALDGDRQQGGDEFVLELPPQEAQVLLAAQAKGVELSPALRKRNDDSHRNRVATKLVDDETFNKLAEDVETIVVPATPSK